MAQTPTKRIAVAGGVHLATFAHGQGASVVLINGIGACAHDWGPTAEQLADRAHVITFDNRGAGQSHIPDEPISLEQMAEDTAAVFDAYGLRRAHLVGYSMGGMIAQILVARRPDLIDRLVLMGTHAGVTNAVPSTPDARAGLLGDESDPSLRPQVVRRRYSAYVAPGFLEQRCDRFERMMAVRLENLIELHAWRRQLQAVLTSDREDLVRDIRAPTLIVHGRLDPLIPFGNGERLRELIPGSRLVAIEDCGHMMNWEKPEAVVTAIVDFLKL